MPIYTVETPRGNAQITTKRRTENFWVAWAKGIKSAGANETIAFGRVFAALIVAQPGLVELVEKIADEEYKP